MLSQENALHEDYNDDRLKILEICFTYNICLYESNIVLHGKLGYLSREISVRMF